MGASLPTEPWPQQPGSGAPLAPPGGPWPLLTHYLGRTHLPAGALLGKEGSRSAEPSGKGGLGTEGRDREGILGPPGA